MLVSQLSHYPLFIFSFPKVLFQFITSLHPFPRTPIPFHIYRLCLFAYRVWLLCFLLLHLWLCDFVSLLLLAFSPLQEQRVKSQWPLLVNNENRTLHLSISDPKVFQLLSPKPAVDICKASYWTCERVMILTRGEFRWAGLYFLCHVQILVDLITWPTEKDRLRLRPPNAAVSIIWQLFPTDMQQHELKLDRNKANSTVEGHPLDNLPGALLPWCLCTNFVFVVGILIIVK